MKNKTKLALLGVLGLLTGAAAFAQSPPDENGPQRPNQQHMGPPPPRLDPEARKKALLDKYDANKDGTLDNTELAAIGKDVVDGKLEPRLAGGRPGGPGGPGFGAGPRGPRGGGDPRMEARHQEILNKYDVNHDGKLDESEHAAIRKDIEDGKLEPPPFGPPGRRGFGPPPGGEPPEAPPQDGQQ